MDGDKFRARADEYVMAACLTTDPIRKVDLMDLAHRWLRLAAQIEAICRTLPVVAERGATTAPEAGDTGELRSHQTSSFVSSAQLLRPADGEPERGRRHKITSPT
jgi:hypothetical protein